MKEEVKSGAGKVRTKESVDTGLTPEKIAEIRHMKHIYELRRKDAMMDRRDGKKMRKGNAFWNDVRKQNEEIEKDGKEDEYENLYPT